MYVCVYMFSYTCTLATHTKVAKLVIEAFRACASKHFLPNPWLLTTRFLRSPVSDAVCSCTGAQIYLRAISPLRIVARQGRTHGGAHGGVGAIGQSPPRCTCPSVKVVDVSVEACNIRQAVGAALPSLGVAPHPLMT